jgi:hypothetical protein
MVLKTQHGSTKKLCRRNTHKCFLLILKKIECKNLFWEAIVSKPHLIVLSHYWMGILDENN